MKTVIVLKGLVLALPIITVVPNADVPGEHPRRTDGVLPPSVQSLQSSPLSLRGLREAAWVAPQQAWLLVMTTREQNQATTFGLRGWIVPKVSLFSEVKGWRTLAIDAACERWKQFLRRKVQLGNFSSAKSKQRVRYFMWIRNVDSCRGFFDFRQTSLLAKLKCVM